MDEVLLWFETAIIWLLIGMFAVPCCVRCERRWKVSVSVLSLIYLFLGMKRYAMSCHAACHLDVECVSCFTDTLFVCIVVCSLWSSSTRAISQSVSVRGGG